MIACLQSLCALRTILAVSTDFIFLITAVLNGVFVYVYDNTNARKRDIACSHALL